MTGAVAKSFGYQLDHLAQHIQTNYNWESPESGFAHYIFYRTASKPPFNVIADSVITSLEPRRLHQAPVLAAVGYEFAAGRTFDESFLESWAKGLTRLASREAFPADRASFFYRPAELLGISLGASHCLKVRPQDLSWLKTVLIEGEHKLVHSDLWTFILGFYAARILDVSWNLKSLPLLEEMSVEELALCKWICSSEQLLAKSFGGNQFDSGLDKALLERCITTAVSPQDTSHAAVLYHSLKITVTQVIHSNWEQYLQVGRSPKEAIQLIKSIGNGFHLAAQQFQSQDDSKSTLEITDDYNIQELLEALLQVRSDNDALIVMAIEAVKHKLVNQGTIITGKNVIFSNSQNNDYSTIAKQDIHALIVEKDSQISWLQNMIETTIQRPNFYAETYLNKGDTMSNSPKKLSQYNLKGAQFAGGLVDAETVHAQQIGGNITNYTPEQRQNLVDAAKEIQQLLQQLEQSYPTTTNAEKMVVVTKAVEEIENNPTLKKRVIGALKAGGTEVIKELVDHPLINVFLAAVEGWQEAQ